MNTLEKTKQILIQSGWFEGRRINIDEQINLLKERKFPIYKAIKDFLEEFGMLLVNVPIDYISEETMLKYNHRPFNVHHTNIVKALGETVDYVDAKQFEYYAGEELVIVGCISNENLFLMVGKSGKVYCDTGKLGDNAWEAWNTLCNPQDNRIIAWQYL